MRLDDFYLHEIEQSDKKNGTIETLQSHFKDKSEINH